MIPPRLKTFHYWVKGCPFMTEASFGAPDRATADHYAATWAKRRGYRIGRRRKKQ